MSLKTLKPWNRHYATNIYGVYAPLSTNNSSFKWISASNVLTNLAIYLRRAQSSDYQKELTARGLTQLIVRKQFSIDWPDYMLADLADLLEPKGTPPDIDRIIPAPESGVPAPGDGPRPLPPLEFDAIPRRLSVASEEGGSGDIQIDRSEFLKRLESEFPLLTELGEAGSLEGATSGLPDALTRFYAVTDDNELTLNREGQELADLIDRINRGRRSDSVFDPFPLLEFNELVLQLLILQIHGPSTDTNLSSILNRFAATTHLQVLPHIASTTPIGLMHVYHQQLTQSGEGYGPILQVLALQPGEQLEVSLEQETNSEYRTSSEFEELIETSVSSQDSNQTDISEEIAMSSQRSSSIAIGASAGTNFAVFNASGSANIQSSDGFAQSDKIISKNLRSYSKRVSEKRTKRVKVVTKSIERETTRQSQRRAIQNNESKIQNFALRQIHRVVDVSVYRQQPRLVWNLYLSDPARHMNRSSYVFFEDQYGLQDPANLADLPPFPDGGSIRKSLKVSIRAEGGKYVVKLPFVLDPSKVPVGVEVTNVKDLRGPRRKSRDRQAALNDAFISVTTPDGKQIEEVLTSEKYEQTNWVATAEISRGDGGPYLVDFTIVYEPSPAAVDEVNRLRTKLIDNVTYEQAQEQFVKKREHLERRARIRPRPADDLRQEERFAIMNRVITHAFGRQELEAVPPGEMEILRTYFDLDEIFVFVHPSWWKPKSREYFAERYAVTDESQAAPLGSSLGWLLQLDGDDKRNYFLNSPWVQVCIPMAEGREEEAAVWLARRIEGTIGVPGDNTEERVASIRKFTREILHEHMKEILDKQCEFHVDEDARDKNIEQLLENGQRLDQLFDEKKLNGKEEKPIAELIPVDNFEVMDVADGLAYQEIDLEQD